MAAIAMLKSFRFTAVVPSVLILSIAETTLSSSINVDYNYPVLTNSDTDNLICYMLTTDGRTLNLNHLCGKPIIKKLVLSCPTIAEPVVKAGISQYCGDNDKCLASAGCSQVPED